jgi:hypothetical protein
LLPVHPFDQRSGLTWTFADSCRPGSKPRRGLSSALVGVLLAPTSEGLVMKMTPLSVLVRLLVAFYFFPRCSP